MSKVELKDELMLALYNLVKLKKHKEKFGKDDFYNDNKQHAWDYAKEVLKKCEVK